MTKVPMVYNPVPILFKLARYLCWNQAPLCEPLVLVFPVSSAALTQQLRLHVRDRAVLHVLQSTSCSVPTSLFTDFAAAAV